MSSAIEHYASTVASIAPRLPGADIAWLKTLRRNALDIFTDIGFPTPRNEDWKYTRVNPIEKRAFTLDQNREPTSGSELSGALDLDGQQLTFVNGVLDSSASEIDTHPGVTLTSLSEAIQRDPDVLEPHLSRYANVAASGFSALNTAFLSEGAYLHLSPGTCLEKPIVLRFISEPGQPEMCVHPRILIVAAEGSRASIVEHYCGNDEAVYFNNPVTEISLGPSACLEHYKLQSEGRKSFHIATLQVAQAHGSKFVSHSISLGGQLVRNDINSELNDAEAVCELNGLYMAKGRQHVDYHTRIDHRKPAGTSRENYKGVLDGRGRGVFNGRVYVHPDAQKTDAEQYNNNLLLSRDAEIDTKPQLEIFADDVKCAHGATVGQLDEDMIFYLRARGIPESAARGLLTYGFASDVLQQMSLATVRDALEQRLVDWLPNGEQVKEMVR